MGKPRGGEKCRPGGDGAQPPCGGGPMHPEHSAHKDNVYQCESQTEGRPGAAPRRVLSRSAEVMRRACRVFLNRMVMRWFGMFRCGYGVRRCNGAVPIL